MSYSIVMNQSAPTFIKGFSQSRITQPHFLKNLHTQNAMKNAQVASKTQEVYFSGLGESLSLKKILPVHYSIDNGYYIIVKSIEGYIIAVAEQSLLELSEAFKEELRDAWKYYALEDDCNLTDNAQKVKRWLLTNIEEE